MKHTGTVLLLLLCAATAAWGQIPNPGFETWVSSPTLFPDGWITTGSLGVGAGVTPSTTAHSGAYALQGDRRQLSWVGGLSPPGMGDLSIHAAPCRPHRLLPAEFSGV